VIAIHRDLPFESAGQFEALEEYIARIVIAFASVPIALTNIATVARIIWFAIKSRLVTRLHPRHLDVADVIVAVAVAGIEVEHGVLTSIADAIVCRDDESDYAKPRSRRQFAIGRRRIL
jgi:hypothetical protein